MNEKAREKAREAVEHTNKATQLLKLSKEIHEAEKQGLIKPEDAMQMALSLNQQAIAEADKAIELQREYYDENNEEK